ncbi:MAG: hypothetical protein K6W08_08330, partial [Firmicutes bacterium]|nr:hypothetical protein [Bacillota bacterium]
MGSSDPNDYWTVRATGTIVFDETGHGGGSGGSGSGGSGSGSDTIVVYGYVYANRFDPENPSHYIY